MSKKCKWTSSLEVEFSLKNVESSLGMQDGRLGSCRPSFCHRDTKLTTICEYLCETLETSREASESSHYKTKTSSSGTKWENLWHLFAFPWPLPYATQYDAVRGNHLYRLSLLGQKQKSGPYVQISGCLGNSRIP